MPERILRELLHAIPEPWGMALLSFLGASFAGLANQLRSGRALTARGVAAAMLNSGFVGVVIFLVGYQSFRDNLPYLVGMSLLAGIGGATILDFAIQLIRRRAAITIQIDAGDKP